MTSFLAIAASALCPGALFTCLRPGVWRLPDAYRENAFVSKAARCAFVYSWLFATGGSPDETSLAIAVFALPHIRPCDIPAAGHWRCRQKSAAGDALGRRPGSSQTIRKTNSQLNQSLNHDMQELCGIMAPVRCHWPE